MTSVSYKLVGTPNDCMALTAYLQAFVSNNCSANLNTWDNINFTIDISYLNTPTNQDVQYLMDVLNAYQDPQYFISYQETQVNSGQSAWATSAGSQILATNQIPAYIVQPTMFNVPPSFVINTIKWLVEFDLSDPTYSADAQTSFNLVDISNPTKQVLRSVTLSISDVQAASFSNEVDPFHCYKNIVFDDLALFTPSTSGVWQLEATPAADIRVRTVSQEIMWYSIKFGINYANAPPLPANVPATEVYKLPSDIKPQLGSSSLTIEPPSWSTVTGPSGIDVTTQPKDPDGYPSDSQRASDSSEAPTPPEPTPSPHDEISSSNHDPGNSIPDSSNADPESSVPESSAPESSNPADSEPSSSVPDA